jgi:hypothetical protein
MTRIRRGVYVPTHEWQALTGRERMLRRMDVEVRAAHGPRVFSHESAAAAWQLPFVGRWPEVPQLTEEPGGRHRTSRVARWHLAPLAESDVTQRAGYAVTSLARTAVDLASTRDLASGVAAFDALLARAMDPRLVRATIERMVGERRPFWGVRKVERALAIATGSAESVLESLSMSRFYELELPSPEQQVEIIVDGRRYRVDFYWREFDVIGEADGRSKYDDAPSEVVWAEKKREDDLRSVVQGFVRWTWDEALAGAPLASKLARAGVRSTI